MRQAITAAGVAAPVGPFSLAVRSGRFVYVSGQVALDESGRLAGGDAAEQSARIFRNLEVVLRAAGCGFADVVRVGVFLTDMRDFSAMNAVFARHFEAPYPARTTVAVAALPLGASIEMDIVAEAPAPE